MNKKLICMTVQSQGDDYPDHKWMRPFIGVLCQSTPVVSKSKSMQAAIIPRYEFMCAAIDALRAIDLIDTLEQIEVIESGKATDGSTGLDAYAAMFDKNKAWFWCEFGPTGEEVEGGQVSLAQFKLAVQTYLRFLQDPERKPIEVMFPD